MNRDLFLALLCNLTGLHYCSVVKYPLLRCFYVLLYHAILLSRYEQRFTLVHVLVKRGVYDLFLLFHDVEKFEKHSFSLLFRTMSCPIKWKHVDVEGWRGGKLEAWSVTASIAERERERDLCVREVAVT